MKIEIIHYRDPDSDCGVDVWIDGVKIEVSDIYTEDIDPGRGYAEEDWQSNIQQVLDAETSPEFKRAALAAYVGASTEYITQTRMITCRHCGRRIVDAGGWARREIWIDPEAPLDLDDQGNLTDDGIWRETCDAHDTITAEHEPEEKN